LKEKASKCRAQIIKEFSMRQMQHGFEAAIKKAIANWEPYPTYTLHRWPTIFAEETVDEK